MRDAGNVIALTVLFAAGIALVLLALSL